MLSDLYINVVKLSQVSFSTDTCLAQLDRAWHSQFSALVQKVNILFRPKISTCRSIKNVLEFFEFLLTQ